MNIGIVIGVSNYLRVNPLPGCVADARSIKLLLELTGKCEDILFITENTDSKNVKSRLAAFVKKYESSDIDEVIFYFSGHGLFDDDEFYYVLSDYAENKTKQTSLENNELDSLLRSLSAKLTVKIVDACQAGTRYVKDPDMFRKYLAQSEKTFNKCYFFYSSQNDQSSYQSESISDFTLSFLDAFIGRPNQEVRYKDVMDTIADKFSSNTKQTPFFVVQGNHTEIFGFINQDVSDELNKITSGSGEEEEKLSEDSCKSLIQLIQEEAGLFCTKSEAIDSLKILEQSILSFSFGVEANEFFNVKIKSEIDSNVPVNTEYVGKNLNSNSHEYMVDIEKDKRSRKVPKNKFLTALNAFLSDADMIDEYYTIPVGASSTVDLPYKFISIRFQAKYPNVNDVGCVILPFVSQTKIIVFSAFYYYKVREWDVKIIDTSSLKWIDFEEYLKEGADLISECESLLKELEDFSLEQLKKRFDLLEGCDEEDS